ncbi:winged helix family transcriptional regulator [Micromonospora sp. BL4]|uniref:winged helix-turn-helix domain-containing protein n=1 Tax=Micromonospora sp. BL4 TaxID=2478710 RepID=UPI000EF57E72|nr:winged helix-turn-helix domain-containing protein [Micromonospora sp. BL4]RLP94904.1 winged helix family transcriptional regulator [Micromonospora sp. BL4]
MSVVAIPSRPHSARRPDRAAPARPRAVPSLTITLDLAPGPLSPRLARLVQLLGELAEAGEGRLRAVDDLPREPRPAPTDRAEPSAAIDADQVSILAGSRIVRRGDRVVPLTRIEYELLLFLAERPRRVFTRLQLLANVWGYEHAVARTVDVHVRRLRAKLTGVPVVTTVYGVGYRLADEAPITVDRSR